MNTSNVTEMNENGSMRELVVVGIYESDVEAQVAKSALESAGIRAVLADENAVGMNWLLGNAIGGVKLQVHRDDLKMAEKVLSDRSPADFPHEENERFDPEEEVPQETSASGSIDEDQEPPLTEREDNASRAFKAALFGLLLCPLQLVAWYYLAWVYFSNERLAPKQRKLAWIALILCVPYALILLNAARQMILLVTNPGEN